MSSFLLLKALHVSCALASAAGFVLRYAWMLSGSRRLEQRWVRILPHVVDTVLLGSAVGLAAVSGQYPLAAPWLTAKVGGVLAYIVLGAVALRYGHSRVQRMLAGALALAVLGWIFSVALSRDPRGVLQLLLA